MAGWLWWASSAGATGAERRTSPGSTPASHITLTGSTRKRMPTRFNTEETVEVGWPHPFEQQTQRSVSLWVGGWLGDSTRLWFCPSVDLMLNGWRFFFFFLQGGSQPQRLSHTHTHGDLRCDSFKRRYAHLQNVNIGNNLHSSSNWSSLCFV